MGREGRGADVPMRATALCANSLIHRRRERHEARPSPNVLVTLECEQAGARLVVGPVALIAPRRDGMLRQRRATVARLAGRDARYERQRRPVGTRTDLRHRELELRRRLGDGDVVLVKLFESPDRERVRHQRD